MGSPSPGRPRSESARQAILAATAELIEQDGYGHVTMEAISRRAGVSKQTIYRWWPTKAAIILEALNEAATAIAPVPDTGSLDTDLRLFLRRTVAGAAGANTRLLAALMAEAQRDDAFAESFRTGFLALRRQVLREVLERARSRGELATSADLDFLVELVFGTLWYRILVRHQPLNRRFADQLADAVLALCGGGADVAERAARGRRAAKAGRLRNG
jgi:AcrR family transcriptional regulator